MTEVTVSARISQELEKEVERLMREEHLEKSAALRKLLHLGVQNYRLERAIRGLGEGRFSLLKAAEEAGLTIWEVLDEAARRQVTWVAEDIMEDIRGRKGR
jgi:AraC-like DNA-binding protein